MAPVAPPVAAELLTTAEVAERLRVTPTTVRLWTRLGRIPEVAISPRMRRYNWGAVVAALQALGCKAE